MATPLRKRTPEEEAAYQARILAATRPMGGLVPPPVTVPPPTPTPIPVVAASPVFAAPPPVQPGGLIRPTVGPVSDVTAPAPSPLLTGNPVVDQVRKGLMNPQVMGNPMVVPTLGRPLAASVAAAPSGLMAPGPAAPAFRTTRDTPGYVTTETPNGIIRRPPGADMAAPVGAGGPKPGFTRMQTANGFVDVPTGTKDSTSDIAANMTDAGADRLAKLPPGGLMARSPQDFGAAVRSGTAFKTGISGADMAAAEASSGIPPGLNSAEKKAWRIKQGKLDQVYGARSGLMGQQIEGNLAGKRIDATAEENKARTAGEYGVLGRQVGADASMRNTETKTASTEKIAAGKYDTALALGADKGRVAMSINDSRVAADRDTNALDNATRQKLGVDLNEVLLERAKIQKSDTYGDIFTKLGDVMPAINFATPQEAATYYKTATSFILSKNAQQERARQPVQSGLTPPMPAGAASGQSKIDLAQARVNRMLATNPNDPEALRIQAELDRMKANLGK